MNTVDIIANNISSLMNERNVSVSDLADHLGVTRQTMANYLKGSTPIDSVKLISIAAFFGVDVQQLLPPTEKIPQTPTALFRTALHYNDADNDVSEIIIEYIEKYQIIAERAGKKSAFIPEQYNLSIEQEGKVIDINFDCTDYSASKLKLTEALEFEISQIANAQRRILGLENDGAISLIEAIRHRGINLIFLPFDNCKISGLSICDESFGCFIFVNSNTDISIERQLFTVAHEYAHILLHRPLYKRRMRQYLDPKKRKNLLDAMADCFAGYLLCPRTLLEPYADKIAVFANNGNLALLIPIKRNLQISLSALMMALKRNNFINNSLLSSYFSFLRKNKLEEKEIAGITPEDDLGQRFYAVKDSSIVQMLRSSGNISSITASDLEFFLNLSEATANSVLNEWRAENNNRQLRIE